MKKIYLLKFLLLTFFAFAQPKLFVGNNGKFRVSPGTLVYAGGGVKMVGSGKIDNSGNFYIKGTTSDAFITAANNTDNTSTKTNGGNFVLSLNDPANPTTSTYGQLYISGLAQNQITGIVDKEYKSVAHGDFQQIALPFYGKLVSELGTELTGSNFTNSRTSKNLLLIYNNTLARADGVFNTGTITIPYGYYMAGTLVFKPNDKKYIVKGVPVSDQATALVTGIDLSGAAANVTFGTYGENKNIYREPYYTYIQDGFDASTSYDATTGEWKNNYGKNIYQFGNPFLTNIDLYNIGRLEGTSPDDGNYISNIQAIRYEVSGVVSGADGSYSTGFKYVSFVSGVPSGTVNGVPVGDVNGLIIKPMETFVIKLKDNTSSPKLYFNTLRRFKQTPRTTGSYSVTSAKTDSKLLKSASSYSLNSGSTVKQLGIIALDAQGKEVDRTYFVVHNQAATGHSTKPSAQIAAGFTNMIGTFEELPEGGVDESTADDYWLYINEANEATFKGKELPMFLYDDNKIIKKLKFEILEDAVEVQKNRSLLSNGESFYIKGFTGQNLIPVVNGQELEVSTDEFGIFYGFPENGTLETRENLKPSLTKVVFDDLDKKYKVLFAKNWKKADVYIFDMSGRLISSDKGIDANLVYTLKLNDDVKSAYLIKLVSDQGEIVNRKVVK